MNNNWLKYLVALAAVMIAGSAAYFSVTGLGVLFSGAAVAVMIMASSLEFAKLVTATYLKQEWDSIKGLNKWYLTFSVVILMGITSAGIFGYLSNAFQQQNLKLDQVQREVDVWNNKIKLTNDQIVTLQGQQKDLSSTQNTLLAKGKVNSRLLRSADNRDKQSTVLSNKINSLQDSIVVYNGKINEIKNNNIDIEREVGGFRFVAEAFGVELKSVVKFFIILIVIVFDPLAVALIISFNQLVMVKRKDDETEEEPSKIDASDLVGEVSKIRLSENDLKKLEEILLNPPAPNEKLKEAAQIYSEKVKEKHIHIEDLPEEVIKAREALENITFLEEDTLSDWDGTLMDGLEDETPFFTEEELKKILEIDNNLVRHEEEYDEHILQYEPTLEEEEQNFSTIEPNTENIFQDEDGWTEEMEQRYWDEQVSEPFATPEEVEKFGIDVQILDDALETTNEIIDEDTSSENDEKKK